jgi:hypothetical protein
MAKNHGSRVKDDKQYEGSRSKRSKPALAGDASRLPRTAYGPNRTGPSRPTRAERRRSPR